MSDYTRRTHIVRISPDDPPSNNYVDVEVLDAIAFRIEGNKEVILNMDQAKADPLIKDDTGGGHGKEPGQPTQRTHMKRITNKDDTTQQLDVEVMDCLAFRDQNGEEWILDMQNGSGDGAAQFNISDGTGSASATRRVHTEIVTSPAGQKKADAGGNYITSIRSDNISFRKVRGEEVIISCPSADDKNGSNVDFGRASTYVSSPQDYDPTNPSGPTPPTLKESGDQHNYVSFVKDAGGFLTGDAKIDMGPFWWIRNISSGGGVVIVSVSYSMARNDVAPPIPEPIPLSVTPWSAPPLDTFGDASAFTFPTSGPSTPIVNPVSAKMLANLDQWMVSTAPIRKNQSSTHEGTGGQYYIYDPWTIEYYNFFGTAVPVPNAENFATPWYAGGPSWLSSAFYDYNIGPLFGGPGNPDGNALIGIGLTEPFDPRLFLSIQTSAADAAYVVGVRNQVKQWISTFYFDPSPAFSIPWTFVQLTPGVPGTKRFAVSGSVVFALNISKAKTKQDPITKDPVFTFQLTVPGSLSTDGAVNIQACAFKPSVKDFPLDPATNIPTFAPFVAPPGDPTGIPPATATDPKTGKPTSGKLGSTSSNGGIVTGKVNTKTLEITFTP